MSKHIGDMILYNVEELSEMLDVQPATIRKYLRTGKIFGKKLARRWYVTGDSLKDYFIEKPTKY